MKYGKDFFMETDKFVKLPVLNSVHGLRGFFRKIAEIARITLGNILQLIFYSLLVSSLPRLIWPC